MLQQQTPTIEAMPSPILDSQPSTSIKDYLFNIGKTYNENGIDGAMTAMASDAIMRDKLTPDHIQALAYSPQKKTNTPEQIAVAGLAGGMATTNIAEQLAQKYGINLQQPKANSPQQVTSFTQGVQQALEQLKVDPASPEGQANQAYFGALFRGAGIKGAVDTYAKIYQKALERDSLLRNTVLAETIKRDIKLQETQALQQQFTSTATKTLASSGVATEAIPQLSQQIGQVLVTAKENPALAQGSAQSIIQNLIDSNAPTETVNKVAAMMSKAMDISKDDSDQVRALQAAGASDRLIARYRFGLQDATDAAQAQKLLETQVRKQGEAKNQLEVDKAKALVPVEVDKHRQTKAIDIAADIAKEKQLMPLQIQKAGLQKQAEAAGEVLGQTPGLTAQIADINKAVGILDSGKHNIGSGLSTIVGRGKVAQAIGSQFETDDAKNTNMVMDTVNKLATDGLKSLGANPSTVDLQFWTENKPKANSNPEFVKEWIQAAQVKIANRVGWAQQTLGQPNVPLAPAAPDSKKPEAPKVRKFNPQTGKLE
jgi:hypothetical protein